MMKGAIILFAFSLLLWGCQAKTVYLPPSDPISPSKPSEGMAPLPEPSTEAISVPEPPAEAVPVPEAHAETIPVPEIPAEPTPVPESPREEVSEPVPPPSVEEVLALPDLTISDITLDETGRVVVTLSNVGKGRFPSQTGSLKVYVDDELKWETAFGDIPDQTFLDPGGVTRYETPVEVEGTHPVRAAIDVDEEVCEEDKLNNMVSRVLSYEMALLLPTPPAVSPPSEPEAPREILLYSDVAVRDLSLNGQRRLVARLSNTGDAPFPLQEGTLKVYVDGVLKGSYSLGSLSERSYLSPKEETSFLTSLTVVGRHEIYASLEIGPGANERNPGNKALRKILESLPVGPDLVVKELELTEDFELLIVLSNAGDGELRKGTTLRIRIFLNDQKVSDFDHFVTEALRPHLGNDYVIDPPYRVTVGGNTKVRVVISTKLIADDLRPENNTLERRFAVYPFRIDPQSTHVFPFFPSPLRRKEQPQTGKVKAEVRWDGGGSPLRMSLRRGADWGAIAPVSGKSPLRMDIPIEGERIQKGKAWRIAIANLMDKRAEGVLIIQSP